ncbi:BPL/LPL catalytic domain-containing protein [Meloidogyne graminicola]|uniref:lipoyl(octanoyl) transferase n=1 Tax=Meloidogyne graminicola TaxID=189291 RepID=A0A8T0A4F4_9BILA|nr:BPL/LPL catalytic domain-containing protein [Meloidogyne graminicola]
MSNQTRKLWQTVVCTNGAVAAWHPSVPFPYWPVDLSQIEEQKKKFLTNIQKHKDSTKPVGGSGPSDLELREIFYTSMQEWRPRYRETRLYKSAGPRELKSAPSNKMALFFGEVPYLTGLNIQEFLFKQICLQKLPNEHYLCMFEHNPPAYTVGIRESLYTEEAEQKVIKLGAEFHRVKRGGLITFHGPGQLVAYPIFNLHNISLNNQKTLGVRDFVFSIEQVLIQMIKQKFKLENVGRTENAGVWVDKQKKIAAIGIQVRNGITSHGLALNCETNLKWFDNIIPCGLHNKSTTSLSQELNKKIKVNDVIYPLCEYFEKVFNLSIVLDNNAKVDYFVLLERN